MNADIQSREDIIRLVDAFYEKVKQDATIGYIFNEVAKVNWVKHLPRMYDFWENVLFYTGGYEGNPINTHRQLNKKTPLNEDHFKHWNLLFSSTVDELFEGEKAIMAKQRALSISTVMQIKIFGSGDLLG